MKIVGGDSGASGGGIIGAQIAAAELEGKWRTRTLCTDCGSQVASAPAVQQLGVEWADTCSRLDDGPAAARGLLVANRIARAVRGCSRQPAAARLYASPATRIGLIMSENKIEGKQRPMVQTRNDGSPFETEFAGPRNGIQIYSPTAGG